MPRRPTVARKSKYDETLSGTALTMAGIAPQLGVLVRPNWKSFRVGATCRFPVSAAGLIADVAIMFLAVLFCWLLFR